MLNIKWIMKCQMLANTSGKPKPSIIVTYYFVTKTHFRLRHLLISFQHIRIVCTIKCNNDRFSPALLQTLHKNSGKGKYGKVCQAFSICPLYLLHSSLYFLWNSFFCPLISIFFLPLEGKETRKENSKIRYYFSNPNHAMFTEGYCSC